LILKAFPELIELNGMPIDREELQTSSIIQQAEEMEEEEN